MDIQDMTFTECVLLREKLSKEYRCMTREQRENTKRGRDLYKQIVQLADYIKKQEQEVGVRYDMVDMKHYLDCLHQHQHKNRSWIASFVDCVFTLTKLVIGRMFCKTK